MRQLAKNYICRLSRPRTSTTTMIGEKILVFSFLILYLIWNDEMYRTRTFVFFFITNLIYIHQVD